MVDEDGWRSDGLANVLGNLPHGRSRFEVTSPERDVLDRGQAVQKPLPIEGNHPDALLDESENHAFSYAATPPRNDRDLLGPFPVDLPAKLPVVACPAIGEAIEQPHDPDGKEDSSRGAQASLSHERLDQGVFKDLTHCMRRSIGKKGQNGARPCRLPCKKGNRLARKKQTRHLEQGSRHPSRTGKAFWNFRLPSVRPQPNHAWPIQDTHIQTRRAPTSTPAAP
ncbi:hypothetical protein VTK73DRAFT_4046 [Phialemonium thermophilum]|uniref:Uncharacterized protein n=1 Tax=Phialemonium thermophilum TaxID=223376 RepID=A0ABR3WVD5_9PEZI